MQIAAMPFVVENTSASVSRVQGRPVATVREAAPHVHDQPAPMIHGARGPDVAVADEVGGERVAHAREAGLDRAMNLDRDLDRHAALL